MRAAEFFKWVESGEYDSILNRTTIIEKNEAVKKSTPALLMEAR